MSVLGYVLSFLFLFPLLLGWIFMLMLPFGALALGAFVAPEAIRRAVKKPFRKRVLIVEDDIGMKLMLEQIVKSAAPHAIVTASSSEADASRMLSENAKIRNHYDFVIADIFLDGPGTGIDLWRKYRDHKMPFMFASITEKSKYDQMLNDLNEPATFIKPEFLQKPLDPVACRNLIRNAIGSA